MDWRNLAQDCYDNVLLVAEVAVLGKTYQCFYVQSTHKRTAIWARAAEEDRANSRLVVRCASLWWLGEFFQDSKITISFKKARMKLSPDNLSSGSWLWSFLKESAWCPNDSLIFTVGSNPDPYKIRTVFDCQCSMRSSGTCRPKFTYFFEMQWRMPRILFEHAETFFCALLNRFRKSFKASPEPCCRSMHLEIL